MSRSLSIYTPEHDVRVLITAFMKSFYEENSEMQLQIPELIGYTLPKDPQRRLLTISEAFVGQPDPTNDAQTEPRFPLLLITYPDFVPIPVGIGSQINHYADLTITNKHGGQFLYHDIVTKQNVVLSYATEKRREWIQRLYHYQCSINIDVIANSIESRKILSDLTRAIFAQYLAELNPFLQISAPFMLDGFQYETEDGVRKSGYIDPLTHEPSYYPAFFPFARFPVIFDTPDLQGTGTYDRVDIFGTTGLYVSSFSVENVRSEGYHLVEVDPGPWRATYDPDLDC